MRERRIVSNMHLTNASDLGGFSSNTVNALTSNQQMHFTQL